MEKKRLYSHLTFEERVAIEKGIEKQHSFSEIAEDIGKDRSTVSREVKRNRIRKRSELAMDRRICRHTNESCPVSKKCGICIKQSCCGCRKACSPSCLSFEEKECPALDKPPYVCNKCRKKLACSYPRYYYNAKNAENRANEILSSSRSGANLTDDEFRRLDRIVRDGLSRGLSPYQIIQQSGGEEGLGICERTFYAYINSGIFPGICRLDLPARMYKPRKKSIQRMYKVDKRCLDGRRYDDFLEYMESFGDDPPCIVEIDTVVGSPDSDGFCLLTIHFVKTRFQLAYVRKRNDSRSVADVFNLLYEKLGRDDFMRLFPVILTDNGSEFSDPAAIENAPDGTRRTRLFYTHPNSSFEKGSCEKNHVHIRQIIPKGSAIRISQSQAQLMMSHINSVPRKSLNGFSPVQLFSLLYGDGILDKLGISRIPADEITLKPSLLSM